MTRPVDKPSDTRDISHLQNDMYEQKRRRGQAEKEHFVMEIVLSFGGGDSA